jgi:hypothetical protein
MLPQAAPDTRELLATARVILALACDPNKPLTVMSLAERAGLHEEAVLEVLRSPTWFDLMAQEFRTKVGLMLTRGLTVMDMIVNQGKRDTDRIAAYRALVATYEVMNNKTDTQDEWERVKLFQNKLDALRKLKQAKVTVVS